MCIRDRVKAAVREDSGFQMLLKEGEQVTVKKRIEENVKAPVKQGQVAVSYTHLDVYKRQELRGNGSEI